jgi:hypothetical protein
MGGVGAGTRQPGGQGLSFSDTLRNTGDRIMAKRQQTFQRAARKRKAEQRLRAAIARERQEQQELEQDGTVADEQPSQEQPQDDAAADGSAEE